MNGREDAQNCPLDGSGLSVRGLSNKHHTPQKPENLGVSQDFCLVDLNL